MDGLPAAALVDERGNALDLKLKLPAAPIEYLASLEEAVARCNSGIFILLIPKVEAGIEFSTRLDTVSHICSTLLSCSYVRAIHNLFMRVT